MDFPSDDDPFQRQMNRGSYLRQLRLLALEDELERSHPSSSSSSNDDGMYEEKKCDDYSHREEGEEVHLLETGETLLNYSSYLSHQRYYDDLKHIDVNFIHYSFGNELKMNNNLIIEQRKNLGKGGFCWDAAFILGEHVIAHQQQWNHRESDGEKTTVLELGAGTGLCGLMIAKATNARVLLTDLPELMGLLRDNVRRNNFPSDGTGGGGSVEPRILRWGHREDYVDAPFRVIVGADIVASLYDPVLLARTLHALSGRRTRIYISSKSRLDKPHEEFDEEMKRLFDRVERVRPESRLKNPHVFIMVFEGKRDVVL